MLGPTERRDSFLMLPERVSIKFCNPDVRLFKDNWPDEDLNLMSSIDGISEIHSKLKELLASLESLLTMLVAAMDDNLILGDLFILENIFCRSDALILGISSLCKSLIKGAASANLFHVNI